MKKYRFLLIVLAASLMSTMCGCSAQEWEDFLGLNQPSEALFVLSFHRPVAYPQGDLQAELALRTPDGRTRFVERYPIMSSHTIIEASAQPVPGKDGFYRIFLRPDQKGRMMWMQLTAQSQNENTAILLDGVYIGDFKTIKVGTGTEKWVELPLDIDAARALNIVKYSNDNYRFFNGGSREDKNLVFPENSRGESSVIDAADPFDHSGGRLEYPHGFRAHQQSLSGTLRQAHDLPCT